MTTENATTMTDTNENTNENTPDAPETTMTVDNALTMSDIVTAYRDRNLESWKLMTAGATSESLPKALVSNPELAFTGLAEIVLRNPDRVERKAGAKYSFARRDRGVAFDLVTRFLTGLELSAEDVLAALQLAYSYRKQLTEAMNDC